jgi:hypothetical protein
LITRKSCALLRLVEQSFSINVVALKRGHDRTIRQSVRDDEIQAAVLGVLHLLQRDPRRFII